MYIHIYIHTHIEVQPDMYVLVLASFPLASVSAAGNNNITCTQCILYMIYTLSICTHL